MTPLRLSLALDRPNVLRFSRLVRSSERSQVETRLLERVEREIRKTSVVLAPLAPTLVRQVARHERTELALSPAPMAVAAARAASPSEVLAAVSGGGQSAPAASTPALTALPGASVEPLRGTVDTPPAPDLDAIATQVLRRIERRAIAQRERMGRG
jgi:hypothetical protein